MTELSARFALPLLQAGQAQKELHHNEALTRIDAALHPAVAEHATATPPAVPAAGDSWIVGDGASGAWAGRAGNIATWTGGGWRFVAPVDGMRAWLKDRQRWVWHDGAAWQDAPLPVAGLAVDGLRVVGPRRPAITGPAGGATLDMEARSTLNAILGALREHGLIDT
ncbi:DUF2793 domain-containing protein [Sphingomonas solaris]|uniref:DUF2793 domain-containing protein n=1 Tax=Alterirhizorhabdus solaris TaxID=2529389 RepID=UPI001EF12A86|nr:DUF2793 domain-containing protein [Sphingomonas solaris]